LIQKSSTDAGAVGIRARTGYVSHRSSQRCAGEDPKWHWRPRECVHYDTAI
jgi:hypothetical protein